MTQLKDLPEHNAEQTAEKADLIKRAKAVGLDNTATKAQVVKAEDSDRPAA